MAFAIDLNFLILIFINRLVIYCSSELFSLEEERMFDLIIIEGHLS